MDQVLTSIKDDKIIAIMRTDYPEALEQVVSSLQEGGIRIIEVTLNTPDALKKIEVLKTTFPDMIIGAGTVLDAETARAAILSGASFLLAPTLHPDVIQMANRYQVLVIPGVFTPTEILTAVEYGAKVVKVFPVGTLGPSYIKELKGPLSHIEMIPVGGVTTENAQQFLEAGSFALGMGSFLVNDQLIKDQAFSEIKQRAKKLVDIVASFRKGNEQE